MAFTMTQVRKGNIIKLDGNYFKVLDAMHVTPGNLRGFVQLKIRNLSNGASQTKRFNSTEAAELAYLSRHNCQYLYPEGKGWVFMDNETYDQFTLGEDVVGDAMKYVRLNQDVQINYLDGTPVEVELPASVTLEVVEAEPAIRGNTATNITKKAVCDTGLEVKVPPHIDVGELISIDTRTGDFLGRAKE